MSTYKPISSNDSVATRTLLHEVIPLTGTIVSGTYLDNNIKNYSHQMFQSVYDYPYLSSSANHIFDITVGISSDSSLSSSLGTQIAKKSITIIKWHNLWLVIIPQIKYKNLIKMVI